MEKKTKKKRKKKPVIFRAHWQRYAKPEVWTDLLVYLCSGSRGEQNADTDLLERLKQIEKFDDDAAGPAPPPRPPPPTTPPPPPPPFRVKITHPKKNEKVAGELKIIAKTIGGAGKVSVELFVSRKSLGYMKLKGQGKEPWTQI